MDEQQQNTSDLDPYVQEARILIDTAITNALSTTEKYLNDGFLAERKPETISVGNKVNYDDYSGISSNIPWLTGEEFTLQRGKDKIEQFVKTWKYNESWLFCIDFLSEEDHDCDTRYLYRVRWSIPTRRKPIPRATASVYFTIKISKFKPKSFPVEVFYVFETNRLVHRPGEAKFQQKWLKDIIDSKIYLMNEIKF